MKHTVSFFKRRIKEINDRLERENYIHRLRGQFVMDKGHLNKVAFYYRSIHAFGVLSPTDILTEVLSVRQAEHWLDQFNPKLNGFEISREDKFLNGFDSWSAVYFEIAVNLDPAREGSHAYFRYLVEGREGLYGLAREMTTKFESENRGRQWEGELMETIRRFCREAKL